MKTAKIATSQNVMGAINRKVLPIRNRNIKDSGGHGRMWRLELKEKTPKKTRPENKTLKSSSKEKDCQETCARGSSSVSDQSTAIDQSATWFKKQNTIEGRQEDARGIWRKFSGECCYNIRIRGSKCQRRRSKDKINDQKFENSSKGNNTKASTNTSTKKLINQSW